MITDMSRDDLVALHVGLGAWIRNHFGLWSGNRTLLDSTGTHSADDVSAAIIEAMWHRLRDEVPKVH